MWLGGTSQLISNAHFVQYMQSQEGRCALNQNLERHCRNWRFNIKASWISLQHGVKPGCGTHWRLWVIKRGTLRAVTDRSYIRELYPDICSASFVLECAEGAGRIVGEFADFLTCANAYRGELLGLLAIHLILLAVNEVEPNLTGSVSIYSDCPRALEKVATLPTTRVPCRSKHADILKIMMIHCQNFTFNCRYHCKLKPPTNSRYIRRHANISANMPAICHY